MKQAQHLRRHLATLLLLAVTTLTWAYNFEKDGIYYNTNTDGTSVTVTYKTTSYNSYSGSVTIPSTVTDGGTIYNVTSIGSSAFYGCTGLTSVTIPESVSTIGSRAFSGCTGLASVTLNSNDVVSKTYTSGSNFGTIFGSQVKEYVLGDDIKAIGDYAFRNCTSLTSITIPNSVTNIGNSAFSGCTGLSSVTIPESVTNIGNYTFSHCSSLTSVTIPNSVKSIGSSAFSGCTGLTSVTIGNSVTSIDNNAFRDCSALTSVSIGNSVTSIGKYAFDGCKGLTSVTIPNSVTSIGEKAFYGCYGLKSVTIPESVTSIGDEAFYNCTGLTKAEFASIESLCKINFGSYYSNPLYYAKHLYINGQEVTDVVIPNSVTSIGKYAFYRCSGLTSITIGNNVTNIGYAAFWECTGLTSVTCHAQNVPTTGTNVFYNVPQSSATLYVPAESVDAYKSASQWSSFGEIRAIGEVADFSVNGIYYHTNLGVNTAYVTYNTDYKSYSGAVVIPSTVAYGDKTYDVTGIGSSAFSGCTGLTSVTIGNSVTSIGSNAFSGCDHLTSVTIGNSVTNIGKYAFDYCTGLTKAEFASIESLCNINFYDYIANPLCYAKHLYVNGQEVKDLVIPNSVTNIGNQAFRGCSSLTSVTIGNSVNSIGSSAFMDCSGLTSVTIPESVTSIGDYAFRNCSGLTSVTIGNSVTSIGSSAFYNCSGLTKAEFASIESLFKINFGSSTANPLYYAKLYVNGQEVTDIVIPESVTSIDYQAFYNCSGLTSVTINNNAIISKTYTSSSNLITIFGSQVKEYVLGDNITAIGNYAFYGYTGLTSVAMGKNVTSIGSYAFYNCSGLIYVTIPESVTSIGSYAFYNCGLTSIMIPKSTKNIGLWSFSGCSNLVDITVEAGNSVYDSRNSCKAIIETTTNTLFQGCKFSTIPNDVVEIAAGAFWGMGDMYYITIPASVSVVRKSAFGNYDKLNVTFMGVTPPEMEDKAFSVPSKVFVTVPGGSSNTYSSFGFAEIKEDDFPLFSINLTEPGMLQDKILDLDDTDIHRLKLTGFITASDISYLRSSERFTNLNYLDISEITLVPSEEPYAYFSIIEKYSTGGLVGSNYARFYISDSEQNVVESSYANGLGGVNTIYAYHSRTLAGAFAGMNLEYVILPSSFDRVGPFCFMDCKKLQKVSLPNNSGFKFIDEFAFTHCESLEKLLLPSSVIFIGAKAFGGCKLLNNIGRLDNVKYLGKGSFVDCASLRNVGSLASVEIMDYGDANGLNDTPSCFARCTSLVGDIETGILDLSSCKNIPNNTFQACSSIHTVKFSKNLKSIGSNAFNGCTSISSITLPESVTSIGEDAFDGTAWYNNQPDGLVYAGKVAYKYKGTMPSGTEIAIKDGTLGIAGSAFYKCTGLKSVTIPNSVTEIYMDVFYGCSNLTSVTIGSGVTSIGDRAFYNCTGLTKAEFASIESLCKIRFDTGINGNYSNPLRYAKHLYINGQEVKDLVIPNSVTSIGNYAFINCIGLKSATIPNSVTNIGSSAFYNCNGLKSVTIPNSVTNIGSSAFYNCTGLKSVTIGNSVTSIGISAFSGCTGLTKAEFASIESLCKINFGNYDANPLYYAKHLYINGQEVKDVVIPSNITSINASTFYGCTGLTSITIPNSITSIGSSAFYGCTGLTKVTLNSNSIVSNTSSISNLKTIFGSQVKEYVLGDNITSIGSSAFYGCTGLTSVTIPNSVTNIGSSAFYNCSGLTSVTIGNSVTSIYSSAFYNCSSLRSVTCYAQNVPSTGASAFNKVPQSTATLYVPAESIDAYKSTSPWSIFGTILPITPTAVESLTADEISGKDRTDAAIYDLYGRRLNEKPSRGFYIQGGRKFFAK